jgi:hypothetical protein
MKPIHVYQCKDDCCLVQVHGRRFWYIEDAHARTSHTSFCEAIALAQQLALKLPQEVTA